MDIHFYNNSTRSFPTINTLLRFQSATLQPSGSSHKPGQPLPEALSMPIQAYSRGNISQSLVTQSGLASRSHSSDAPHILLNAPATTSTTLTPISPVFLELYINIGKFLKSLGEIDVSLVNTNGDFFSTVKAHYFRLRGFRAQF